MKIAVCTTFPIDYWDICAEEMVRTFNEYWPDECEFFIALDQVDDATYNEMYAKIAQAMAGSDKEYYISNGATPEQRGFYDRTTDDLSKTYRFHVKKFSHKVFALQQTAHHIDQVGGYDYLIWLDADVITKQPVTLDKLKEWLPENGVSTLWRKDAPHPECGFVAYAKDCMIDVLDAMVDYYVSGKVYELSGWTDCDVLDAVTVNYQRKNLTENISGWHVMPQIDMGNYLEHRKGNRKLKSQAQQQPQQPFSLENLNVKTRNCVENDLIKEQVSENIKVIRNWVKPLPYNDEEIVICSAGDSLNVDDILPFYKRGVKIVAVKHAVDRLLEWGIKPWACILLDPRPHVEKFVQKPDRDILYFVSSMVHPSVIKTLLENKCRVIGYHAFVNAGEQKVLNAGEYMVSGGSATATRGISLLNECLGFQTFHLFGYDLCHFGKPDKQEMLDDGNPKFIEITLTELGWGNRPYKKTFWSEGQFLAQAKELRDLYAGPNPINITVYGDGIGGWSYKNWKANKAWGEKFRADLNSIREKGFNINEWIRSIY